MLSRTINTIRTFLGLKDTPSSYSGKKGGFLHVNPDEDAISFDIAERINVLHYGTAYPATTTTGTITAGQNSLIVADGSSFADGDYVAIDRAGATETTGDTTSGNATISNVADTSAYSVGEVLRIINGVNAQKQARLITIAVVGNTGDTYYVIINGETFYYEVQGGDTSSNVVGGLVTAINGGQSAVTATNAGSGGLKLEAAVAGTLFTYENRRPTGKGRVTYSTTQRNISQQDHITTLSSKTANTLTLADAPLVTIAGATITKLHRRLLTTVQSVSGNTLTLADNATQSVTDATVWHDYQPAFASAQAHAKTLNVPLYVPQGKFYLCQHSSLSMQDIPLVGAGMGNSVISVLPRNDEAFYWFMSNANIENVSVEDITIDCNINPFPQGARTYEGKQEALYFDIASGGPYYNKNLSIRRVEARNCTRGAVLFHPQNVDITDCYFHDAFGGVLVSNKDAGAASFEIDSHTVEVAGCVIENISHLGMFFYSVNNTSVYGNGHIRNISVHDNIVRSCYTGGIENYGSNYDCLIADNIISYCGTGSIFGDNPSAPLGGIIAKWSSGTTIQGNHVHDCSIGAYVIGLYWDNAANVIPALRAVLKSNGFFDCSSYGVQVQNGSDDIDIVDNTIDGFGQCCLRGVNITVPAAYAKSVGNVRVAGNVISNNQTGLAAFYYVENLRIERNNFLNNNVMSAAGNTYSDIYLQGDGSKKITNITIENNSFTDISGRTTKAKYPVYATYCDTIRYANNESSGHTTADSPEYTATVTNANLFTTFTNADATPSVAVGNLFTSSNTGATTVTSFDDGYSGQGIEIVHTTANTTYNETGNIKLMGGTTLTPSTDDVVRFRRSGTTWYQVGGGGGLSSPLAADLDFNGYKAVAMACDSGTTLPTGPTEGQWFLHTPTGRKYLMLYANSQWNLHFAYGTTALYVDTTDGTDAADKGTGTGTAAYKTIQYAINQLPGLIGGPVTINIAAGTYTENPAIRGKTFTTTASVTFNGATSQTLSDTMTGGTNGTGTVEGTVVKTAAGWAADAYKGLILKFTSGSNNGRIKIVHTNTSDTITFIGGALPATPMSGDTFQILDWATTISGFMKVFPGQFGITGTYLKVVNSSSGTFRNSGEASLSYCHLEGQQPWACDGNSLQSAYLTSCSIKATVNSAQAVFLQSGASTIVAQCLVWKSAGITSSDGLTAQRFSTCMVREGTVIEGNSGDLFAKGINAADGSFVTIVGGWAASPKTTVKYCTNGLYASVGQITGGSSAVILASNTTDKYPSGATAPSYID